MHLRKDQYLIIYAVLAAAITVGGIVLVPIVIEATKPAKEVPTPEGSFGQVTVKSRYEIQVRMGNCTPMTNYSDCDLVITTPTNEKATLSLVKDKYTYAMTGMLSKLTELRLSDVNGVGLVGAEDYLTLYHSYPIQIGLWRMQLVYRESGKDIAARPVVAPDTESHPLGDFLSSSQSNPSKYQLAVGIISPTTDYAYCRLMVDPPGAQYAPKSFDLAEGNSQTFFYDSQIRVKLIAQNEYGVPQSGDTIDITVSTGTLPAGQWTVALIYKFDGGRIVVKVFSVT